MTREDIEGLVSRRLDVMNRHDTAALVRFYARDCVLESPSAGGTVTGLRAIDEVNRAWVSTFPDLRFATEALAIDGDRLAWITRAQGTGAGEFMGLPTTGRGFSMPMVLLSRLHVGLIVHERRVYDFTGMLIQLGVLKARAGGADPADGRSVSALMHPDVGSAGTADARETIAALLAARREYWRRHDAGAIAAQHAADAVMDSHIAGRISGRDAIEAAYRSWFAAFPDADLATGDLIVDGALAVESAMLSGTDTGGWLGVAPTGRPFRLPSVWTYAIRGGELAYVRPVYDFTGMLVQLGLLKAKPV